MHPLHPTNAAQDILESAPIGCAVIGTSDYTFLNVNDQFCRLCGYRKDEIIGRTIGDLRLFTEHDHGRSFQELIQLQESFRNVPIRMRRPSGDWREIMSSGKLIVNGEDSHLLGMFVDQTREKQLQRRLLEARQEERRRIGEDLQQWLAQMLTGIELLSLSLTEELENQDSGLTSKARELNDYIRQANSFTNDLTEHVLPVEMDPEGLAGALHRLSHTTQQLHEVNCCLSIDGVIRIPNHTVATTLYEIADKAVTYAVKSGNVSNIELTVTTDDEYARLTVADDRAGGSTAPGDDREARETLELLRHHVALLNGSLQVQQSAEDGPRIACTVPQADAADASHLP